jgi:hypothetical protein
MMEITALFPTFSFDTSGLIKVITEKGWEVKKVKYDKKTDRWTASAKAPHGEEVESWGRDEHQALVALAYRVTHLNSSRSSKVAAWQHSFVDQLVPIAEAYAKASLYDSKAAQSFMALAHDCTRRAEAIKEHLTILIVNDPEPYKSPEQMYDDIRKRHQLKVSTVGAKHTIWSKEEVIVYRICHDVLGYAAVDSQWDWEGENRAFSAHVAVVPAEAQSALFTESIGQTAYATYYRAYGPKKITLLKNFFDPAQKKNNPHDGFRGIHPSQMLMPTERPEAKPPHEAHIAKRIPPQPGANGQLPYDINTGYESRVSQGDVPPNFQYPQQYDKALDDSALNLNELGDLVQGNPTNGIKGLHTGWADPLQGSKGNVKAEWEKYKEVDPSGATRIETAVSNAIRVAALSPRTLLHQNAQHYQDLQGVPHRETDPNAYWNALEEARKKWNTDRFGSEAAEEHRPWNLATSATPADPVKGTPAKPAERAPVMQLAQVVYARNPELGQAAAIKQAEREIFQVKTQVQSRLAQKLDENPSTTDRDMWILDNSANKIVLNWIKAVTKPHHPGDEYLPSQDESDQMINQYIDERNNTPFEEREAARKQVDPQQMGMFGEPQQPDWPLNPPKQDSLGITHVDYSKRPEFEGYDNDKVMNKSRYGAFMGTAMQTISRLTAHLDDIVVTALEDVHDHDGTGHHFRTYILSLDVPGVGPKIISFMWLLLQPLTSQLATIDVHMAKLMGYQEKDVNDRDYFRIERELQAMRDAQGLQQTPLGQYQWAEWDGGRNGINANDPQMSLLGKPQLSGHQDHSFMRVLNPTPVADVPIHPKPGERNYNDPRIQSLKPAAQLETEAWDQQIAPNFGKDEVPTQGSLPGQTLNFTASTPWVIHPDTGQRLIGQENQTKMQHFRSLGLGVNDVWNKFDDSMVGAV